MDNQSNDVDGTVLMIRLEIQDGAGPVPVLAEPQICLSPLCPCTEMRLQIRPASLDDSGLPQNFILFLDLERQSLSEVTSREEPAARDLAERLESQITPQLWALARNYFMETKEAQLATANLATLKPCFPPELAWDPSRLISYGGIVPCSRPLLFSLEGQTWQAMDDYCVNPPCTCNEAHLTFRTWPEGAPWGPSVHGDTLGTGPVACLSLPGPGWTSVKAPAAGFPTLDHLMTALEGAWPSLRQVLATRRGIIRRLAAVPLARPGFRFEPHTPTHSTKVGRNEPCPCGSGKKFKRCCG